MSIGCWVDSSGGGWGWNGVVGEWGCCCCCCCYCEWWVLESRCRCEWVRVWVWVCLQMGAFCWGCCVLTKTKRYGTIELITALHAVKGHYMWRDKYTKNRSRQGRLANKSVEDASVAFGIKSKGWSTTLADLFFLQEASECKEWSIVQPTTTTTTTTTNGCELSVIHVWTSQSNAFIIHPFRVCQCWYAHFIRMHSSIINVSFCYLFAGGCHQLLIHLPFHDTR